jgi:mono/diheme cytochrome c family protein
MATTETNSRTVAAKRMAPIRRTSAIRRIGPVLVLLVSTPLALLATTPAADVVEEPTFARHVAPIFQAKCQSCHQPESVAPMALLTYEQTRPWARSIKRAVATRRMPPWHIDKNVGIRHFKNDRSLTDDEIDTIVRWVDSGAPFGDAADLPEPVEWPDPREWQLGAEFGEPDLVIRSLPFTVPAAGQDKWWRPTVDTGLTEPRWVKAIEIRPSFPEGRKVVHHVLASLIQEEETITGLASTAADPEEQADSRRRGAGLFMEWAVGKVGEVFPDGAGKLMLPSSQIRFEVHYHSVGEEVNDDVVELGVYFYPKGEVPENRTILHAFQGRSGELDIQPGEISVSQGFHVLRAPARLENFQPHMHMRGKAMALEAIRPDGRSELINIVDRFNWNWHINYVYAEDVAPVLPKGTVLKVTAWHDNTAENPHNPDPEQWVGYGDRTVDEMAHLWVDVTYLEQEQYEKIVAARQQESPEPSESEEP